jgi:hypothetical protein
MQRLGQKYGSGTLARFEGLMGGAPGEGASGMMTAMSGPLEQVIQSVGVHTQRIAESARTYLPTAIASASAISSAVAMAADALPAYRLLGARLAIEAALKQEVFAMVGMPEPAPEAAEPPVPSEPPSNPTA